MIPAVSQPAVPPPTMTTARTACMTGSEMQAGPHGKGASVVDDIQNLILEPSSGDVLSIVEVQRLEEHVDVPVDIVAGGEVHRLRCLEERRLGSRGRVVLR